MRLEKMIERLAEKTNTPILAEVLRGERDIKELPTECMIWTGAKQGDTKPRMIMRRDSDNMPYQDIITERPYGIVRWKRKMVSAHRLIFQILHEPDYDYKMNCQCGVPLCVNPLHFGVTEISSPEPAPEEIIEMDSDWTFEEVEEMLEIFLTENNPKDWSEVVDHPLLEDIPRDLLREGLQALSKEHLT